MFKRFLVICIILMASSSSAADGSLFGEPLSDAQPVRIGDLLSHPDRYVDRRVKIVGLVDDVCPMKGCWVDILARQGRETIRFKVQDDVIVFPAQAIGRQIVAEGILRREQMSEDRARDWLAHLAAEKGETYDPGAHSGPLEFYQIEGLGAELDDPVSRNQQ